MADIFVDEGVEALGNQKASTSIMSLTGIDNLGVVTNLSLQFSRPIQKIFDMTGVQGSGAYLVGGRADGQGSVGRLSSGASGQMLAKLGDLCGGTPDLGFEMPQECGNGQNALKYTCISPFMTAFALSGESQSMVFSENLTFTFLNLQYSDNFVGPRQPQQLRGVAV